MRSEQPGNSEEGKVLPLPKLEEAFFPLLKRVYARSFAKLSVGAFLLHLPMLLLTTLAFLSKEGGGARALTLLLNVPFALLCPFLAIALSAIITADSLDEKDNSIYENLLVIFSKALTLGSLALQLILIFCVIGVFILLGTLGLAFTFYVIVKNIVANSEPLWQSFSSISIWIGLLTFAVISATISILSLNGVIVRNHSAFSSIKEAFKTLLASFTSFLSFLSTALFLGAFGAIVQCVITFIGVTPKDALFVFINLVPSIFAALTGYVFYTILYLKHAPCPKATPQILLSLE